ncbi:MAG: hypothetical protein C4523_12735 [Myxococcales bacterium]|nr:MAG: hypothetical protein C4523_12735 [Myxococcales bacterium]
MSRMLWILLILTGAGLLWAGCEGSETNEPSDSDGDASEQELTEDSDEENGEEESVDLCEPGDFRCHPESPDIVQICRNDGEGWETYRECSEGMQCVDDNCEALADADETDDEPDGDEDGDVPVDGDPVDTDGDESTEETDDENDDEEDDGLAVPCPGHPEMMLVEDFCIDKYEAVAMENSDCTGTIYGQNEDDFPEGFQDCVNCMEDGLCVDHFDCRTEAWAPQTEPVYACSVPGIIPTRFITWYQARRACVNVGKTLCSSDQWVQACEGPENNEFPYGPDYMDSVCWDNAGGEEPLESPGETGGRIGCESSYGVFDQSGNVSEWLSTAEVEGINYYLINGCYWLCDHTNTEALSCVGEIPYYTGAWISRESIGFRCCLNQDQD